MKQSRSFWLPIVALPLGMASVSATGASVVASEADCFDAEVTATIVGQTPTDVPDCGDDCIIMRWPWIVDLRVGRVHRGNAARGPLTVLTVQHSHYRTDLGARRWLLRRTTIGIFNVLQPPEGQTLALCPVNASPARPYYRPAPGQTLDDVRRAGEERFGRRP